MPTGPTCAWRGAGAAARGPLPGANAVYSESRRMSQRSLGKEGREGQLGGGNSISKGTEA